MRQLAIINNQTRIYFLYAEFSPNMRSHITTAFSCGARTAFKLKEQSYLRAMLSRRQLQGFVMLRRWLRRRVESWPARNHSTAATIWLIPASNTERIPQAQLPYSPRHFESLQAYRSSQPLSRNDRPRDASFRLPRRLLEIPRRDLLFATPLNDVRTLPGQCKAT